jgi:hypothetical protein
MRAFARLLLVVASLIALWVVFAGGNPGGISDARYAQFNSLAAPKLLYSCTRSPTRKSLNRQVKDCMKSGRANCDAIVDDLVKAGTRTDVDFVGGAEGSTYDQVLEEARRDCRRHFGTTEPGEFKVLEAEKS